MKKTKESKESLSVHRRKEGQTETWQTETWQTEKNKKSDDRIKSLYISNHNKCDWVKLTY